jgi:SAM-dependent methyltransferase
MNQQHDLSAHYWDQRYVAQDFGWDLGEISTPLKTYFDQLQDISLSILIPGAGNAYEAEYLVKKGFRAVYVCDFALSPLQNLKKRCPDINEKHLLHFDFFELKNLQFDLIIEQTFFCALDPKLRKKYFQKMHELLKPNGRLAGLLFDDALNADQPPFGGNAAEYKTYFKDLFTIHHFEPCYNSIKPRAERELFIDLIKQD